MATELSTAKPIEVQPEFAGILRQDEYYATGNDDSTSEQVNGWFDQLVIQSGMEMAPSMLLLLCLCSALMFGGLVFVLQENLLTAGIAVAIGSCLPLVITMLMRNRRQRTMLNQMPPMLEELARAAKTGRSLDNCFQQVSEDTPAPLGDELRLSAARSKLGIPLPAAVSGLWNRTGLVSLNLLATALKVHHQTGGDIVRVLDRLERSVRDRISFLGRLRSATVASRATAVLMLVIPPAVLIFFIFRDPAYMTRLLDSYWGRIVTILAVVLQMVGTVWVFQVLKKSQK